MTTIERVAAIISWGFAGIGGLVRLVIYFAAGMKAVPHMEASEAMIAIPLPVVSAIIAVLLLSSCRRRQATRSCLLWTLPPLCAAALSLLLVFATWLLHPGNE